MDLNSSRGERTLPSFQFIGNLHVEWAEFRQLSHENLLSGQA